MMPISGNLWPIDIARDAMNDVRPRMPETVYTEKGFTVIEILMVMIIIGILTQMGMTFFNDLKKRSYDAVAIADGKNLMNAVGNSFVLLEDVDYNHAAADGGNIGTQTTGGSSRSAVFQLSSGVKAIIFGESLSVPGSSSVTAYLWHESGTDSSSSIAGSGKREFYFAIDEFSSSISVPKLTGVE